jgi:hypothetical protein
LFELRDKELVFRALILQVFHRLEVLPLLVHQLHHGQAIVAGIRMGLGLEKRYRVQQHLCIQVSHVVPLIYTKTIIGLSLNRFIHMLVIFRQKMQRLVIA